MSVDANSSGKAAQRESDYAMYDAITEPTIARLRWESSPPFLEQFPYSTVRFA
jgi:hypothetical protein